VRIGELRFSQAGPDSTPAMIAILIAAYNEAAELRRMLPLIPASLLGHGVVAMVASDGSTDGTVAVARDAGCRTVESCFNRGKGATLRMGIAALADTGYDVLVLMDGDGQHDPADLEQLVLPLLEGSADMVVGSRYTNACGREQAPWNRYAVRCATTTLLSRLLRRRFTDPYCGYRAMTRGTVDLMDLEGDRYQSELEMLFAATEHELDVREVPIAKIYGPHTTKMGARHGAVLGRIDVVGQYVGAIAKRSLRLRRTRLNSDHPQLPV
jgi:glycosyltransferase involved in cell wall biosynthesis